jgi:predicted alpha/beta-hydrolase family hydrolase
MPSDVILHVVKGGDHSLTVRKSAAMSQQDVYATVLQTIASWIHSV